MGKVAKLVRVSLVTRVIVDEDATKQDIMELAIPKLSENMMDFPSQMITEIEDDEECPYDEDDELSLSAAEISVMEKARRMLSACDDAELVKMVRAITNHEDKEEIIDYIEDVVVWQPYEHSFTVEQFLKEVGYTGVEFRDSEIQFGEDQIDSFKTWLSAQVFVDPHMEYLIPIHFDSSLSYEENFSNLQQIYLK